MAEGWAPSVPLPGQVCGNFVYVRKLLFLQLLLLPSPPKISRTSGSCTKTNLPSPLTAPTLHKVKLIYSCLF